MSQTTGNTNKITALARRLRDLDTGECVEIIPSPNFSHLALIRDLNDPAQAGLWMTLAESQELEPLVTFQDLIHSTKSAEGTVLTRPRWSSNGEWLAFSSYEGLPPGKAHRLWAVKAKAGAKPRLLYKGTGVIAAHLWSPEGDCLAVADSEAGLVIVQRDGVSKIVDAEAMRYPLGENALAWIDEGRQLLYTNLSSEKAGLWSLTQLSEQKRQIVSLSQDEIMIPAAVSDKGQVAWGALRGNMRQRENGAELCFWSVGEDKLKTIPLPNVEFDPASHLLPNGNGSLWAFTVWQGGQRIPFIVDRLTEQCRTLAVSDVVMQILHWSDAPCRLWVLFHPPQLTALDIDRAVEASQSTEEPFFIDLTSAELTYLLELLGGGTILGLENPFTEKPKDEIQKLKEEAKASLITQDYIAELPDGRVQVDLTLAAVVKCCASSQQTWTITFKDASKRTISHSHRVQDLIVENTILSSGIHRLMPLRDQEALIERIGQQLQLGQQAASSGQSFVLPEEILFRVKEIAAASGQDAAVQYLVNAGVAAETATHFARTLLEPTSNGSISQWLFKDETTTGSEEGISTLEGPSGLWLLQPFVAEGAVRIKISPVDAAAAQRQIASLFVKQG